MAVTSTFSNGGFESSVVPATGYAVGVGADSVGKWAFTQGAGVYKTGNQFDGANLAPQAGSNAGFIFESNDPTYAEQSITQGFNVSVAGTATLTFYSAQTNTSTSAFTLMVNLRGANNTINQDFSIVPTTSYVQSTMVFGNLPVGTYVLTFSPYEPPQGGTTQIGYVTGLVYIDTVVLT